MKSERLFPRTKSWNIHSYRKGFTDNSEPHAGQWKKRPAKLWKAVRQLLSTPSSKRRTLDINSRRFSINESDLAEKKTWQGKLRAVLGKVTPKTRRRNVNFASMATRGWEKVTRVKKDSRLREERLMLTRQIPAHPNLMRTDSGPNEKMSISALLHKTSNKRLPATLVKTIGLNLLSGIRHLHKNSFIHCNITPDCLFVDKKGGCRVGDFDSVIGKNSSQPVYCMAQYASPEVLAGQRINAKLDSWSVGATLYEIISGQPFVKGDDIFEDVNRFVLEFGLPKNAPAQEKIDFFILNEISRLQRVLSKETPRRFSDDDIYCLRQLLSGLLSCRASKRFSSRKALNSPFFNNVKG